MTDMYRLYKLIDDLSQKLQYHKNMQTYEQAHPEEDAAMPDPEEADQDGLECDDTAEKRANTIIRLEKWIDVLSEKTI